MAVDSVKRCKKVYCPKFLAKTKKIAIKMNKKLAQALGNKKLSNKTLKKVMNTAKYEKKMLDACVKGYCNPSCKDTIFEEGAELPKSLVQKLKKDFKKEKDYKQILHFLQHTRKNLFGKKKNILLNSFYEKLSKKQIKKLMKEGAISGCSML